MPRVAGQSVAAAAGAARRSSKASAPADPPASTSASPSVGDGSLPAAAQLATKQPALPPPAATATTPASSPMLSASEAAGEAGAAAATPGRQSGEKKADEAAASGDVAADEILVAQHAPPADRRPTQTAPVRKSPRNKKPPAADVRAAEGEAAQATPAAAASPRRRSPAARSRAASPSPTAAATNSTPLAKKSHKKKVVESVVVASKVDGGARAGSHGRGQPSPAPAAAPSAAPPSAASPLTAAPSGSAAPTKAKQSHKKKPPVPPVPTFTEGSPLPPQPQQTPLAGAAAAPARPAIEGAELPSPSTLLASTAVQTDLVQPLSLLQSAAIRDPALPPPFAAQSPLRSQSAPSVMATKAPALQPAQLLQSPAATPAAAPAVTATSPMAPPVEPSQVAPEERAEPRLAVGCSELSLSTLQIALADVIAAASAAGADELPRVRTGQSLDADRRRLLVVAALQSQESLPPFAPRRALVQTLSLAHKSCQVDVIALPEAQSHEDEGMTLLHSASLSSASLVQLRARVSQWQREAGGISRPLQPRPSQRPSERSPTAGAFDQWQRGELERQRLEAAGEPVAEEMDGAADELLLPLFAPQRAEPLVQLADEEEEKEEKFEVTELEQEEKAVFEGEEPVTATQTASVEILPSPPADVAEAAAAASVTSALQPSSRAHPPPQLTPSPSTPAAPPSKRPRADRSAEEGAEKHAALQQQQQQQKRRQEDELLQLERQMIAQPVAAAAKVQPAFAAPAVAAATPTPQLAPVAVAAAASVAPAPVAVVISSDGGFLPAEVIHVPPSAEAFDVHRALFAALTAAGTFPALRRAGLSDSSEATLQGWPPVRVLRLLAAKWKHVAAAARTKHAGSFTASQHSDLRSAQHSYRDLQLLFHCAAVSFQLLHAGVTAANFFHMRLARLPPWTRILQSTEIGQPDQQPSAQGRVGRGPSPVGASSLTRTSGPISRLDLLRPVGALLQRLSSAVLDDGAVADSPKIRALMVLLLRGRWLRQWQTNCREIARAEAEAEREKAAEAEARGAAAAVTLTVGGASRASVKATSTSFAAIPPVRHVTVVLVQSEVSGRALLSFLPVEIGAAVIDPPEPLTAAASAQQKEAAAKKQKEDLDPNTFLRLFRQHGLVIGRAGHILPHSTFPWRSVGALIHFDCLDPCLFWNADAGKVFEPSAEIRKLIGQGAVQSFSLETDTASSLILLPPDERRLRQLLLPVPATAPLRLLADRQWAQRHDDQSQVELVPRDLPVSLILDAQSACVVLELADLINADGAEEAAAIEHLIVDRILLAGGHFRRLFVFFFDPTLPLGPEQPAAVSYSRAEERLTAALGESLSDSPMGPVRWSARRVRGAEVMMIQLLAAISEAKEAAERGQVQSDSPTAAVLAEKPQPPTPPSSAVLTAQRSWFDRGWLAPFPSPAERFLSGFPGLNGHLAALFLGRAGLTVDRLFALTLAEARALAPEADETQLRRMLTFAQTAVRPTATPPARDQAAPTAAAVVGPFAAPSSSLRDQRQDSGSRTSQGQSISEAPVDRRRLFVPVQPPRSQAQPAPSQQIPSQRKRGHDLMAERRAQTAREFAEQRGAVQQFASPQTNPLTTPPEVQPLRQRKGAIAPARPTQLPSLPLPAHDDRAVVAHNGPHTQRWPPQQPHEQPRSRPPSASSQPAHSRSGSAASTAPSVGSRSGRPPSTESQLMETIRHEGGGTVTVGSITGKRKISDGLTGGSSDGSGGSDSSSRQAAAAGRHSASAPTQARRHIDSSEDNSSSADEDVPISSLMPQRAQPDQDTAAAGLWTTPRPLLRSESRPAAMAVATERPGSESGSRPGSGSGSRPEFGSRRSSSSSSDRRSLEAASDEHRRLMEMKRGKKLRVGFGQAADPALQRQRQGVIRVRAEPVSPQRQRTLRAAIERTPSPSPSPSPPPRQRYDGAHARQRDDRFEFEDERAHYQQRALASAGAPFARRGPRPSSASRSASPPPDEIDDEGGRLARGYAAPLRARRDWGPMDGDGEDGAEDEVPLDARPPRALSGSRHSGGHSSVLGRASHSSGPRRSSQSRGFSPPFEIEDRSAHSEWRAHTGSNRRGRSPEFGSGRGRDRRRRAFEFGEEGAADGGESVEELSGVDGHASHSGGAGPQRMDRFERRPQGPVPIGRRQPQPALQPRGRGADGRSGRGYQYLGR